MKWGLFKKRRIIPGRSILAVSIRKRDGLVFEGRAKSFSSINNRGPFDVLPSHANFVCVIQKEIRVVQANNRLKQIEVEKGVLRVKENQLEVFLGI